MLFTQISCFKELANMGSKTVNTTVYYSVSLYSSPNLHRRIFQCVPSIMYVSEFRGMSGAMGVCIWIKVNLKK
jgi:hypothetical protein